MTIEATTPDALPSGAFAGRETFRERIRDAFSAAAAHGWRELVICDASFHDWPLGERDVVQALGRWARNGQQFVMLARHYDDVVRHHALFVEWRRQWSHRIDCRVCASADPLDLPSALWSSAWALQRLDPVRSSGVCGAEPQRRQQVREELDGWLHRSTAGFAATTLGL